MTVSMHAYRLYIMPGTYPLSVKLINQEIHPIDIDDEEDWEDDIIPLFSPPEHLRRQTNINNPINVPDDEDDDDEEMEEDSDPGEEELSRRRIMARGRRALDPPLRRALQRADREKYTANAARNRDEKQPTQSIHRPNKRLVVNLSTSVGSTTPTTSPVKRKHARFAGLEVGVEAGPSHAGPSTTPDNTEPSPAQVFASRIIDILPDICPDWVMREVITAPGPADEGIANVIAKALEEGYPKKADTLAKQNQKEALEPGHQEGYKGKVFHAAKRRGYGYQSKCIEGLSQAFPCIPVHQ